MGQFCDTQLTSWYIQSNIPHLKGFSAACHAVIDVPVFNWIYVALMQDTCCGYTPGRGKIVPCNVMLHSW